MRVALHTKLLAICALSAVGSMAKPIASRATDIPTSVRLFTVQAFQSPYPAGEGLTGYVMNVHDGSFWLSPPPLSANSTPCLVEGYGASSPPCKSPPPSPQKPNATETVLWVDGDGRAFLASRKLKDPPPLFPLSTRPGLLTRTPVPLISQASGARQRVYIDTLQGHLCYDRPPTAHAATAPTPGGAMFALFVHRGHGTAAYTAVVSASPSQNHTAEAPGSFAWVGSEHGLWFACPGGTTATTTEEYRLQKMVMGYGDRSLDGCAVVSLAAIDWNGATPVVDAYA